MVLYNLLYPIELLIQVFSKAVRHPADIVRHQQQPQIEPDILRLVPGIKMIDLLVVIRYQMYQLSFHHSQLLACIIAEKRMDKGVQKIGDNFAGCNFQLQNRHGDKYMVVGNIA